MKEKNFNNPSGDIEIVFTGLKKGVEHFLQYKSSGFFSAKQFVH